MMVGLRWCRYCSRVTSYPRVFEARNPKAKSIISEIEGEVTNIIDNAGRMEVVITNDLETRSYLAPYGAKIRVNVGDHVNIGAKITKGSIDPKELLSVADVEAVENYIIKEFKKYIQFKVSKFLINISKSSLNKC